MEETWKPIVGYEGLYEVSDVGNVRRIGAWTDGRANRIRGIRRLAKTEHGYLRVTLFRDGYKKRFFVHRLVAISFLGEMPEGKQVNHKNGIRHDNRFENLEYLTNAQNGKYSFDVLGRVNTHLQGSKNPLAKLTESQITTIRTMRNSGYQQKEIAAKFGVTQALISGICTGKHWRHIQLLPPTIVSERQS